MSWEGRDPWRDEDGPLSELWPDPDRRVEALARVAERVYSDDRGPTRRELDCLTAASHGLREHETAELLGVAYSTVHDTLARARRVLRAKTTTQAVVLALRAGLIR